jgi:hypothetical protein
VFHIILLLLLVGGAPLLAEAQAQRYARQHPLARDLAVWWRATPGFTGGPKLYDLTGQAHCTLTNMTGTPASGWTTTTRLGGTAQVNFDGTDDLLTCTPPALRGGEYTILTWVRLTSYNNSILANTSYPSSHKLQISLHGGNWGGPQRAIGIQINEIWGNTLGSVNSLPDVPTPWMHIAVTCSASRNASAGYYNGKLTGTSTCESDLFTGVGSSFLIGTYVGGFLSGALDGYMVYNRVLSQGEITRLYTDGMAGHPALLQGPLVVGKAGIPTPASQLLIFFPGRGD